MRTANIVDMEYGSKLYKTDTPESDTDYAGIYMPSMEELLLQKVGKGTSQTTGNDKSKNTRQDVDRVLYPLPTFIRMCLAGDTTALDMLHCDIPITTSPIWEELVSMRKQFYCKNMKAYVGYVKSQAHKYGLKGDKLAELKKSIDTLKSASEHGYEMARMSNIVIWENLPEGEYIKKVVVEGEDIYYDVLGKKYSGTNTVGYVLQQLCKKWDSYGHRAKCAMENQGMDWKALHHALRVAYQVRAILEHGDFHYPLAEHEFLMRVKRGEAHYGDEIAPELDNLLDYITKMSETSNLPDKPDHKFWDKWLIGVYDQYFNIEYKRVEVI